jgi:alcohol dehydrogenase (cytochrome c)
MNFMTRICLLTLATAGATGLALPALAGGVTPERLLNSAAEPQNWLMVYGDYNNHMHSALSQINRETVGGLEFKFAVAVGGTENGPNGNPRQQAMPLVNDGDLFVNNAWNQVLKIDVRSGNRGQVLWRFDPEVDRAHARIIASRGIALLGDNLYMNTLDGRLVGVDADSGEEVFDVSAQYREAPLNQSFTGAPLALKDRILVGQSQAHTGNRGWLAAFSAETGDLIWRFNTVPAPGEAGHETWADDHGAWATGGAAVWTTPAYDPVTDTVVFGTGDPAPWDSPEFRPGDNLYASSTIALDVNTGALTWYFQETPNDSWDFGTYQPRVLVDIEIDGRPRRAVANAGRNGFFYLLDRESGAFIYGQPWTEVTWTAGLDANTGKPIEYNPATLLQDYGGRSIRANSPDNPGLQICPHHSGAPTYLASSYDAERMIAYITGSVGCGEYFDHPLAGVAGPRLTAWQNERRATPIGIIYGIDVRSGSKVVEYHTPLQFYSGLLGTAGDLIFTGHLDGKFAAYDKDTLAEVWSVNVGAPIAAPAMTYAVNGQQYVAVLAGGQDQASHPELKPYTPSSTLFVFGL